MMRMSIVWCAITLNVRILAALALSSLRKKKSVSCVLFRTYMTIINYCEFPVLLCRTQVNPSCLFVIYRLIFFCTFFAGSLYSIKGFNDL